MQQICGCWQYRASCMQNQERSWESPIFCIIYLTIDKYQYIIDLRI